MIFVLLRIKSYDLCKLFLVKLQRSLKECSSKGWWFLPWESGSLPDLPGGSAVGSSPRPAQADVAFPSPFPDVSFPPSRLSRCVWPGCSCKCHPTSPPSSWSRWSSASTITPPAPERLTSCSSSSGAPCRRRSRKSWALPASLPPCCSPARTGRLPWWLLTV